MVAEDSIVISDDEVAALLATATSGLYRALLTVLVYQGLNSNEARQLDVRDVDLDANRLHVRFPRKGGRAKARVLPLHPATVQELRRLVEGHAPDEPLFVTRKCCRISNTSIRRTVRETAKTAGITRLEVSPRELRRKFAWDRFKEGADLKDLADLSGVSHVRTLAGFLYREPDREPAPHRHERIPRAGRRRGGRPRKNEERDRIWHELQEQGASFQKIALDYSRQPGTETSREAVKFAVWTYRRRHGLT